VQSFALVVVQAGDLNGLDHGAVGRDENAQRFAERLVVGGDLQQHAEAGRVEEDHAGQIEDARPVAGVVGADVDGRA